MFDMFKIVVFIIFHLLFAISDLYSQITLKNFNFKNKTDSISTFKFHFIKGDLFYGEMEDGRIISNGCYFFTETGNIYCGEFEDGQLKGLGTMIHKASGNRYEGQWENGGYNGRGVKYFSNGDIWDGFWRDGEFIFGIKRGIVKKT